MGEHVLPGNPPIALILRRSRRARRISLRVSGLDGRVTLTLPNGVAEREAIVFAEQKADWIRKHLTARPDAIIVALGSDVLLAGNVVRIAQGFGQQVQHRDGEILVPGAPSTTSARLRAWLKTQARDRLAEASDRYAKLLGRDYTRLTLRDTRSRWGSCSAQGGLMYSWRLIMAPPDVLDYVAAHEVAHLVEMNHSPAFWANVSQLKPNYEEPRRWLRKNGAMLHRYRFGD